MYRRLLLDNFNRPVDKYSTIDEGPQRDFSFDEVHLMNQASLHVRDINEPISIDIRKLVGDRSGLLHIHKKQKLVAEFEDAVRQAFTSGVNFIIDEDGEIIFPAITYVYGKGVLFPSFGERRSLMIEGQLTGINDLVLGFETLMYLEVNANTASFGNGNAEDPGNVEFGTIDLRGLSQILYQTDVTMKAEVGKIDVRYKARISAESIHLKAGVLNVEAGAMMTSSAKDRPVDTIDSRLGSGLSFTVSSTPTGAGHASPGGGIYNSTGHVVNFGGAYYDSLYRPKERGSSGGQSTSHVGGRGGGVIDLEIASELLVDGEISTDGSNGDSTSGGGSGGTIYVKSKNLEGHGLFTSAGGSGVCGGSGGRIAFWLDTQIYFFGTYQTTGGVGRSQTDLTTGGPGSAYINDTRFGRPYHQFIIDNNARSWDHYYTLDEVGVTDYYFDEVHLTRNISLQLKSGDGINRGLSITKIFGDRTGRLHLKSKQVAHVEELQSVMKSPINLWVDEGARAFLSPVVYMLGMGEIAFMWNGEIVGVRHMRIVPGRKISINPQAQTSWVRNGTLVQGVPGWFQFASLEEGAGAEMILPPPMGLRLTVGFLVRYFFYLQLSLFKIFPLKILTNFIIS